MRTLIYSIDIICLTDLGFQRFCENEYGINRGIYNVVDQWFYDNGFRNVMQRRREILNFFQLEKDEKDNLIQGKIKFGRNRLKSRLEYYQFRITELEIIYS